MVVITWVPVGADLQSEQICTTKANTYVPADHYEYLAETFPLATVCTVYRHN